MKKIGLFILMVTTLLVTVACSKDDRIQVGYYNSYHMKI